MSESDSDVLFPSFSPFLISSFYISKGFFWIFEFDLFANSEVKKAAKKAAKKAVKKEAKKEAKTSVCSFFSLSWSDDPRASTGGFFPNFLFSQL